MTPGIKGVVPLSFSSTQAPITTALALSTMDEKQLPVLARSISLGHVRNSSSLIQRQGFGSNAEALLFRPTVWDGLANRLYEGFRGDLNVVTGRARRGFRLSETNGQIAGLSLEDWMSRFNTLIALYIPQNIIAFKNKSHQMETFGRNVMTWVATFILFKLMKNDSFSFPKLVDKWFLSPEKKLFWGKVNAGLGFDYKDLLRAASNHLTGKGIDASKASFYRISKVQDLINELSQQYGDRLRKIDITKPDKTALGSLENDLKTFFNYRPHQFEALAGKYGHTELDPKGIVSYAKKILDRGPVFLKRLSYSKVAAMVLTTVLFAVIIGDLVLRLNWLTFARLDKDFDPKSLEKRKNAAKEGAKPSLPPLAIFKALPSNLVNSLVTASPAEGGAN